jgi:small subunit ribosomal protein S6e
MKLNIAYPQFRSQQMVEIDDEKKMRIFYDKRISEEVAADPLGDEFKGYVFKITGGFDKQGFAMKQGILLNHRVRLLMDGRTGHYHPKRDGCRKRKSIRGCITGADISTVNVIIVKRGPADLPKLTDKDSDRPSTRGPKRANHIRKVWGLTKKDDVRPYVVKRKIPGKDGKKDKFKSPKIQRLITPALRHRKARAVTLKKRRHEKSLKEASDYAALLAGLRDKKRSALLSKKRELKSTAERKSEAAKPASAKPEAKKGAAAKTTKTAAKPAGGVTKPKVVKAAGDKPKVVAKTAAKPAAAGAKPVAKPAAAKPAAAKPAAAKPAAAKPAATKPAAAKPAAAKPAAAKPATAKPAAAKPAATKPAAAKPAATKPAAKK